MDNNHKKLHISVPKALMGWLSAMTGEYAPTLFLLGRDGFMITKNS